MKKIIVLASTLTLVLVALESVLAAPSDNSREYYLIPDAIQASTPVVPGESVAPAAVNAASMFTFSDPSLITWDGTTSSTSINVSSVIGNVTDVDITLNDLAVQNFGFGVAEFDILLVPPSGAANDVILMSFACDATSGPITVTFDMGATSVIPSGISGEACTSTSYQPGDYSGLVGGYILDAPAPPPPYSTDLGILNGLDPNGVWTLYFEEFAGDEGGQLGSGWTIQIATDAAIAPQSIPSLNIYGLALFIALLSLIGYRHQRVPRRES